MLVPLMDLYAWPIIRHIARVSMKRESEYEEDSKRDQGEDFLTILPNRPLSSQYRFLNLATREKYILQKARTCSLTLTTNQK
ncbi:hypothetical protein WAI453_000893 [Rhynchosporium graminicola]